ncbi:MAG: hypothetical protein CO118_10125 [Flavobacteriales bacterium CG_4_9_14_3_um_filter_32_8]|nr:MAG: hypothetical protein CO118_10125 [Flavobacteriales bacterium CG_4_9_14_3_um_filter_32_8]
MINTNFIINLKKTLLILGLILTVNFVYCQEDSLKEIRTKNSIYLELGGNAFIYSINYDRIFFTKESLHIGVRAGLFFFPNYEGNLSAIPIEFNLLYGRKNSFLEIGIGQTFNLTIEDDLSASTIRLGYRFQRKERGNGFMFRIAALPLCSVHNQQFGLWAGLSLGYAF